MLTALYSRHGKKRFVVGAATDPTANIKVMADEMRPGTVTPAPITEYLSRILKVTVGEHTQRTLPQPRPNLSRPRAPLAQPRLLPLPCDMALRSQVIPTRTLANQVHVRYHLPLLRDGPKTVYHPWDCLRHYTTDVPIQSRRHTGNLHWTKNATVPSSPRF